MNKPQITIKDIARALNVSPSTVSRALKDNPDISKETRDLVHAYAREHNYKPNVLAVNLRASRSNTIGVIVPQLVHHFFSCVLSGIEKAAADAGYNIIVAQSSESYEQEVKIVHSFLAARVCGVIASLAKDTSQYDHYQELLNNDIPIVFYDRICTGLKTERVVVDDYAGSFAAVEYMIQTGCKRILFYGAAPHLEITKNRRNGYLDAMKKYKIPVDDSMICIVFSTYHSPEVLLYTSSAHHGRSLPFQSSGQRLPCSSSLSAYRSLLSALSLSWIQYLSLHPQPVYLL